MRQVSKILSILAAGTILILSFGTTTYAVATNNATTTKETTCSRLDNVLDRLSSDVNTRVAKITTERQNNAAKLAANRSDWDNKIATARKNWDNTRNQYFAKLEAKATTDQQKTAVQTFETSVDAAVTVRRSAYDANRATYRSAVNTAITNNQSDIDQAIATLRSDYSAAVAKAQSSCASGTAYKDVAATLTADLQVARTKFKASRAANPNIAQTVKSLASAEKTADQTADQQFKASVNAAYAQLRTAFNKAV
jgi:hypothetical protein